jgi:hypothetical protein
MLRCWCHAAMAGWLGNAMPGHDPSPESSYRWQAECERAGGDCPARIEAIALRLPTARALRQGRGLTLLTGAGPVRYPDHADDLVPRYRYLGALHDGRRHLLWRRADTGPAFMTVCDVTGRHCEYDALPAALSAPRCEDGECREASAHG